MINPNIESFIAGSMELSTPPARMYFGDVAYSSQLVPEIQNDIRLYLPASRLSDAQWYCGDPSVANDSPTPKDCIWPQGLVPGEYPVVAVEGASTVADLEALVAQTQNFQESRKAENPFTQEYENAFQYQEEWPALLKQANKLKQLVWLRKIMRSDPNSGCLASKEVQIACARLAVKQFLPHKKAFVEEAISKDFPADMYATLDAEYQTIDKPAYATQLGLVIDRWKAIAAEMEANKERLSVVANLPTADNSTELRAAPLFPSVQFPADPALATGVTWSIISGHLDIHFSPEQRILRRQMDTGAIILFGNYPILSLLRSDPQVDAGNLMPLPLPEPQTIPTPNCN